MYTVRLVTDHFASIAHIVIVIVMNRLRHALYWLTHPILCKLSWHRLITWSKDIEGGDKQCWCGEKYGGGWTKNKTIKLSKWFWLKLWLGKIRFIHFKSLYIIFQFLQSSHHGEYDLKLGISYNTKRLYTEGLYEPWQKYKRKARQIQFNFLIGYIGFGYWGKRQKEEVNGNG